MFDTKTVDPKRDIWGALINEHKNAPQESKCADKHFLFVGAQTSGKSSLINLYFSRRAEPQSTIAAEYQSAQLRVNDSEITLNFWEIGSGTTLTELLDAIVEDDTVPNFNIFICCDLENPDTLFTAYNWIDTINNKFNLKNQSTFLIGTRYDKFCERDPAERISTCKTLRAIASYGHAGIMFTSTRNDQLVTKFKALIKELAFPSDKPHEVDLNNSHPLYVWPNEDTETVGNKALIDFRKEKDEYFKKIGEKENEILKRDHHVSLDSHIQSVLKPKNSELDERVKILISNFSSD